MKWLAQVRRGTHCPPQGKEKQQVQKDQPAGDAHSTRIHGDREAVRSFETEYRKFPGKAGLMWGADGR